MTEPLSTSAESDAMKSQSGETTDGPDIRLAAMNLLARREHSIAELREKLRKRYSNEHEIEHQLVRLKEERLQSDERYAESYVRMRTAKGYGPRRVTQELKQKDIDSACIARAFEANEMDWPDLAKQVLEKRFGHGRPMDIKDKARRQRFLEYRGFAREHFEHLI
ncbi:MAG: regulatory protein RecX [Pseudomonadota bacterium]